MGFMVLPHLWLLLGRRVHVSPLQWFAVAYAGLWVLAGLMLWLEHSTKKDMARVLGWDETKARLATDEEYHQAFGAWVKAKRIIK